MTDTDTGRRGEYVQRALEESRTFAADLLHEIERAGPGAKELTARHAQIERRHCELAALYAALESLHATLDFQKVSKSVRQILVESLGAEAYAVFAISSEWRSIDLVMHDGMEPEAMRALLRSRTVMNAVTAGRVLTGEPQVVIPLWVDGEVLGFIAITRLAALGPKLDVAALELLDVVASHAAIALYCSGRRSSSRLELAPPTVFLELLQAAAEREPQL